jgi:hypothetical protein
MAKYRKKPVVIDAFRLPQLDQPVEESFHDWCEEVGFVNWASEREGTISIPTLEGTMTAMPGDWIIKGVKGEFYPCKPDIFAATYEEVFS